MLIKVKNRMPSKLTKNVFCNMFNLLFEIFGVIQKQKQNTVVSHTEKMPTNIAISLLFVLLICASVILVESASTNRPVIGILAQPVSDDRNPLSKKFTTPAEERNSYIAASYVKYVEGAGARVVPIPFDMPASQMLPLVRQLNGLLFPGGGANLNNTLYYQVQKNLLDLVLNKELNIPIWGTCLGMQAIVTAAAQDVNVLTHGWDSWNISLPLEYFPDAQTVREKSKLFSKQNMPSDDMFNNLQHAPITLNNHHDGFTMENWARNARLNKLFRITSTNRDRRGKTFVSTIEAYEYPIYAVQWHPEKPLYEWRPDEDIDHSYASILANQHMANFFVNECRKNGNSFVNENELNNRWLIYNYNALYSYSWEPDFEQIYYFQRWSA